MTDSDVQNLCEIETVHGGFILRSQWPDNDVPCGTARCTEVFTNTRALLAHLQALYKDCIELDDEKRAAKFSLS